MMPLPARLFLLTLFLSGSISAQSASNVWSLRSPDQRIEVRIRAADRLSYDVLLNGRPLLLNSTLSLNINHVNLGVQPKVKAEKQRSENNEIVCPVPQKSVRIREHYNELKLEMEGNYAVVFRAYDEGVGYRLETSLAASEAKVYAEEVRFNFAGDYNVYYPKEDSFFSHNEREFLNLPLKQITPTTLASLPAVVVINNGVKIAIAESDVEDYPGLWLRGANDTGDHHHGSAEILAPMPGKVVRVMVEVGSQIEKGKGVVIVEAMKMQNEMKSPREGSVKAVNVKPGDTVNAGDVLAIVE